MNGDRIDYHISANLLHLVAPFEYNMPFTPTSPSPSRRVIFPSLYDEEPVSPTSTMAMPAIPEAEASESKPSMTFPSLKCRDVSTEQTSLSHLLTLSPLVRTESDASETLGLMMPHILPFVPSLLSSHNNMKEDVQQSSHEDRAISVSKEEPEPGSKTRRRARNVLSVPALPLREPLTQPSTGSLKQNKPLCSILRKSQSLQITSTNHLLSHVNTALGSIESDLPSLEDSVVSIEAASDTRLPSPHRQTSEPLLSSSKRCSFDPRVWIREFERSPEEKIWYTPEEMISFKEEAILRIQTFTELIPTGTGRCVRRVVKPGNKALFSHKALQLESESEKQNSSLPTESVQSILLVDPHEICLNLFAKAFQRAFPAVSISTARSHQEALGHVAATAFDIILVEERLKGSSGSMLLQRLGRLCPQSLLIGVTAHLKEDSLRLQLQADLVWPKPPPALTDPCVENLRSIIRAKRTGK